MRRILLVLMTLAFTIPAAEAAQREARQGTAASRTTQQAANPAQATPRRSSAQRRVALRPGDVRTQRDGVVARGASAARIGRSAASSCTQRNGRRVCAPARSGVAGWQSGLPVASYAQRECPEGTFATLARGHDDVVRCMPL